MKQIKITTSKGEFIVIDVDYNATTFIRIADTATAFLGSEELFDYKESFKLSEITEEQAKNIVGIETQHKSVDINRLMLDTILQSKGIHLYKNPYPDVGLLPSAGQQLYREAKEKTFYNPYIFKL